eukprot:961474-Pyramimonas_sp.AAC.1
MHVHSGAKVPLYPPDFAVIFKIFIRLPPNSNTIFPGPLGTATYAGDPGFSSQDRDERSAAKPRDSRVVASGRLSLSRKT